PTAVSISTPPSITTQPVNRSVTSPAGTTFSVTVSNATGFQWQINDGNGWTNLANTGIYTGATTATLTLSSTATALDGYIYRCIVSGTAPCTSASSNAASLTVAAGPCLSEGFAGGSTPPSGWVFTSMGTLATATNFGVASPSLQFNASDDRVVTSNLASIASSLTFWVKIQTTDATSALLIEGWNGTAWVTVHNRTNLPTTGTNVTYNASSSPALPAGLSQFRFTYSRDIGNLAFDDLSISCEPVACVPGNTITSFLPATGPVGTVVTISGTGFTGATGVRFGGVSATTYTIINSTTITADVPAGALNGKVSVLNASGCAGNSSADFTPIAAGTICGAATSGTELFISEVYDAALGGLSYIEIFNPTGSTINLATPNQYSIRVTNIGDGSGCTTDVNTIDLTGSIASGATFVLRLGTSATLCPSLSPNQTETGSSGFNGNDYMELLKSGTNIDRVNNPSYDGNCGKNPGFTQVRNSSITGPSATYQASQWTNSTTANCSNLGVGPYTVGGSSVTFSPQPLDFTACTVPIIFSVNFAGFGTGSNAIVWRYYNPLTNAWENASGIQTGLYPTITAANTNLANMSISGNVAQLQNYQFYAEITRGSCLTPSNAVQYSYATRPFYRSNVASTGNWSAPSSWQMSNDGTNFVSACSYPNAGNCAEVVIQNGNKITLDVDLDLDKLTINTGGELEIARSKSTSSYEDNSGTTNDATWSMGSAAQIIKTNTSSAAKYRDFYQGGIAAIPNGSGGATFTYRYTAAATTPVTVAAGMQYPNLTFESTNGNFNWNSSTSILSGAADGNCIIKGNFNIGVTGTGTVTVLNNNINSSPMLINGNLNIGNGSTLSNLSFDGTNSASHGFGTGFEVKGNITLTGTGSLISAYNAVSPNSGKLNLTGTALQTITGGSGTITASDATVNNTANLTWDATTNVDRSFTFTNGVVTTNSTRPLTLGSSTTIGGTPNSTKFFNGPLAKQYNSTTPFTYPVGKSGAPVNSGYRPISFTPHTTINTGTLVGEYFTGHPSGSSKSTMVAGVQQNEYWSVSETAGNVDGRITLNYIAPTLSASNWLITYPSSFQDPTSNMNVAILTRPSTALGEWNFTSTNNNFNDAGSPPEARLNTSNGEVITKPLTSYSYFTFGYNLNTVLTLPVQLLSFEGRWQGTDAQLHWQIADTKTLAGFELQHSADGNRFSTLASVAPLGQRYQRLHSNAPQGANYYRLKTNHKNGSHQYSRTVLLVKGKAPTTIVGLVQNPVGSQALVQVYSAANQRATATLTDVAGRTLLRTDAALQTGHQQLALPLGLLLPGQYYLHLRTADGVQKTLVLRK
ncbi:MAG: hypothetical protein EAY75_05540, partial [Bacteroidetes bacterium]